MKTKATRESTRGKRPYDTTQAAKKQKPIRERKPCNASSSKLLPCASASFPAAKFPTTPRPGAVPFRQTCLEVVKRLYPKTQPRNDWDVLQLGTNPKREDDPEALYAWLDEHYESNIRTHGREMIDQSVKTVLDTYMEQTGKKPCAEDPLVFVRPIPDSQYSLRLFPGSISRAEYCLDFVDSKTGEPINSPFEHELWSIPNPDTPWLTMAMVGKLRSVERGHGVRQEDILPGEEKYILRDGQTCVLTRPGKRSVRFTVPVRRQPELEEAEPMDVIDFPKVIDL